MSEDIILLLIACLLSFLIGWYGRLLADLRDDLR